MYVLYSDRYLSLNLARWGSSMPRSPLVGEQPLQGNSRLRMNEGPASADMSVPFDFLRGTPEVLFNVLPCSVQEVVGDAVDMDGELIASPRQA